MEYTPEIKAINVAEHYTDVDGLMRSLHIHEKELSPTIADWDNDIREGYMRHVITMQEECEGTFLMVYADDKPVGFIFGYLDEPDDSRIDTYKGKALYISDGYMEPNYRRHGIYRELNKHIEDIYIAQGIKRIFRLTHANNKRMQHFLDSEGYELTRLQYEKWVE